MRRRGFAVRMATTASLVVAAASLMAGSANAQKVPADLTQIGPVPTDYVPKKTAWGDPDFRATYQIENLNAMKILFQRPKGYGLRQWLTPDEYQKRVAAAKASDASFSGGESINTRGTEGLGTWIQNASIAHRTSMLIDPPDGQLPPLTPAADKAYKAGRSSWVPGQEYDWVSDFDSWDRCISRGFPASMYPFRYNNGIRIFQAPGYVIVVLEMLGTRVIPIDGPTGGKKLTNWPGPVEAWMGSSRGHWEGNTLVVETTNIKSGDGAQEDPHRAASPVNMATQGVPPFNTIPTSKSAHVTERFTMTSPTSIVHQLTYNDPEVFTKPWTTRIEWARDDKYEFYEYACHEGDVQIRGYISSSKAHRANVAAGKNNPDEVDSRSRFAVPFDRDPAAPLAPGEVPPAPRAPRGGDGANAGGQRGGGAAAAPGQPAQPARR